MAVNLRVVLVRHGETDWNVNARYQGQQDTSLNENGLRQARALGRHMASWPVLAVYSSDLKRTRTTAEHVAAPHGLPVNLDPDLREMAFGEWEGLTASEIKARWPGVYDRWLDDPVSTRPPNGENLAELGDRAAAAVHRVVSGVAARETASGEGIPCIIIVAHGGPIRAILCVAMGLSLRTGFWNVGASPGSYAVLRARMETRAGHSCHGETLPVGLTVEQVNVVPA
ncbi:MAG: histidine phosphatase family protein [Ignavibacteriales bacterium]